MEGDVTGCAFYNVGDYADIGRQRQRRHATGAPVAGEAAPAHDVQRVYLESRDPEGDDALQAFHRMVSALAGQSDDEMGAHGQPVALHERHGVTIFAEAMAAVNAREGFVETRLEAEFYPYGKPTFPIGSEQGHNLFRQAVGARADAKANHARDRQCLFIGG